MPELQDNRQIDHWTIAQVKAALPQVAVRIGKQVVMGRLSGRLNSFATVSVTNQGTLHSHSTIFMDKHVAWQTVVRCLNTNQPIIFE